MNTKPKKGDKIATWFSEQPDGKSTVLDVRPYTGKYTRDFQWIVTVTAPRTNKGQLEICL